MKNLYLILHSPGLGDTCVRLPGIKFLSHYFNIYIETSGHHLFDEFIEEYCKNITIIRSSKYYRFSKIIIKILSILDIFYLSKNNIKYDYLISYNLDISFLSKIIIYFKLILRSHFQFDKILDHINNISIYNNIHTNNYIDSYLFLSYKIVSTNYPNLVTAPNKFFFTKQFFNKNYSQLVIAIAPGAKTQMQIWPHFLPLANKLHHQGFKLLFFGNASEKAMLSNFEKYGDIYCGYLPSALTKIVKNCDLFISNDSGFGHFCLLNKLQGIIIISDFSKSSKKWYSYPDNIVSILSFDFLFDDSYNQIKKILNKLKESCSDV